MNAPLIELCNLANFDYLSFRKLQLLNSAKQNTQIISFISASPVIAGYSTLRMEIEDSV